MSRNIPDPILAWQPEGMVGGGISAKADCTAMMKLMARYGWYIFLIPSLILLLDDFETDWHHHGHERLLYIVLENGVENAAVLLGYLAWRWWQDRAMRHIHAECPKCHHQ